MTGDAGGAVAGGAAARRDRLLGAVRRPGGAAPGGGAVGTGIGWLASLLAERRTGLRLAATAASGPLRLAAGRALHRQALDEDPAHVRDGLAADQAALVEEPRVLAVELLERVVAEDAGADLVGDAQHEGVAAADRAGRRGDELVVGDGEVELRRLLLVDAVAERGVDHDRDRWRPGYSSLNAITASLSCVRLGIERPSVAMLDPSTTTTSVGLDFDVVMSCFCA